MQAPEAARRLIDAGGSDALAGFFGCLVMVLAGLGVLFLIFILMVALS